MVLNQRVVVLGSNSFSGSHFVDFLLDEGAEVVGISRSPEPDPVFLPYKKRPNGEFRFHPLDLNRDLDAVMKVIREWRPQYVVNFASQSMVAESWQHPEDWFQTNAVATVRLHDRLRQCDFLDKYVHVSTPEVYGNCTGLVSENTAYEPSTPYAVSRAAADMSLMTFHRQYHFPVVFTRAANVYGPGQQLYRIIPRVILYCLIGKKVQLHGGGVSVRSFIHVRDVAEGTVRVMRRAAPGEIFHLSTTRNIAIRSLVEMICDQMGFVFEDHVEVAPERPGKDAAYLLDSTKARRQLQWEDRISLEEGIRQTIAWVKDNLAVLARQPLDYVHKP